MPDNLLDLYQERRALLGLLANSLQQETADLLSGVPHIDRIYYRVKTADSFIAKAVDPSNNPPYTAPLSEIEDQVAGRVIVFFLSDIPVVRRRVLKTFRPVEVSRRQPPRDQEFGYESEHLICMIPPHVKPPGWEALVQRPSTFELQLRTIFMHAYAEPQHDIAYKVTSDLSKGTRRELAWIAASAWGADQAYLRIVRNSESTSSLGDTEPET